VHLGRTALSANKRETSPQTGLLKPANEIPERNQILLHGFAHKVDFREICVEADRLAQDC